MLFLPGIKYPPVAALWRLYAKRRPNNKSEAESELRYSVSSLLCSSERFSLNENSLAGTALIAGLRYLTLFLNSSLEILSYMMPIFLPAVLKALSTTSICFFLCIAVSEILRRADPFFTVGYRIACANTSAFNNSLDKYIVVFS